MVVQNRHVLWRIGERRATALSNKNVPDPRNWQGSGNRSVANMFIDLGQRVSLSDEQFREEMARRRTKLNLTRNDNVIGCPLCTVMPAASPVLPSGQNQQ